MKKNIILILLSITSLISSSFAMNNPLFYSNDKSANNPLYLGSLSEKNIESIATTTGNKLYVISRNYNQYCLTRVKVRSNMGAADSATKCFAAENIIGTKIIQSHVSDSSLYIISNKGIYQYDLDFHGLTKKNMKFSNKIDHKVIKVYFNQGNNSIYILTSDDDSSTGEIIHYSLDRRGNIVADDIRRVDYKPKLARFVSSKMYVSSDKSIYEYDISGKNGSISTDKQLLQYSDSTINDFDVFDSKGVSVVNNDIMAVALHYVDDYSDTIHGILKLYNVHNKEISLSKTYNESEDIKKVYFNTSSSTLLMLFDEGYSFNTVKSDDLSISKFKAVDRFGKFGFNDVIDHNAEKNSFIKAFRDKDLIVQVFDDKYVTYNIASADEFFKAATYNSSIKPLQMSLKWPDYFAVADDKAIDIYRA